MKRDKTKIIYEPKDDVLNIWLSPNKLYEYGEDEDGVITHYTKDGEPVYIEVLFASRFFKDMKRSKSTKQKVSASSAVLHKLNK